MALYSEKWTREKQREYQREWMRKKRAGDPDFRKAGSLKARLWQKANPFSYSWNNNRASARKRAWEWQLDQATHDALLVGDCVYCGAKPNPVNGIDRIDNNLGYVPSNVASACGDCNYAKRKMSVEQFIEWATKVAHYSGKDK